MTERLLLAAIALMPLSSLLGGLLLLAGWLLLPRKRSQPAPADKRLSLGLIAFGILSLLTAFSSAMPAWHLAGWLARYGLMGLLTAGFYRALLQGRLRPDTLAQGLMAGSLGLALCACLNYFLHWQTHLQLLCFESYGGFCLLDLLLLAEDRARSFSMHPNVLGVLLALALPLWLWTLGKVKGLHKVPVLAGMSMVGLALLVSFSRAAWLAAALSLAVGCFWLLSASWRQSLLLVTAGALLACAGPLAHRLSLTGSGQTRLQLWAAGWRMLREHLWTGTGLLQLEPLLPLYASPVAGGAGHLHNWYLQVTVESGLPAALVFFGLLSLLHGKARNLPPLGQACWLAWMGFGLASFFDVTILDVRVAFSASLLMALLLQQRALARQLELLRAATAPPRQRGLPPDQPDRPASDQNSAY